MGKSFFNENEAQALCFRGVRRKADCHSGAECNEAIESCINSAIEKGFPSRGSLRFFVYTQNDSA